MVRAAYKLGELCYSVMKEQYLRVVLRGAFLEACLELPYRIMGKQCLHSTEELQFSQVSKGELGACYTC